MRIANLVHCSSHIPILVKVLEKTDGKVLELGCGISTIIIQTMCAGMKRPVVSYEHSKEWYEEYKKYQTDFHDIRYIDDWDKADIDNEFWDVVLVDHAPDRRRPEEVKRLANKANYIILHDSDILVKFYQQSGLYKLFKYKYYYKDCFPNTVVLSNFINLNEEL